MSKLSIITVTYNAATSIERTIKSVLEQTYCNIEHIIIDGNSSDGTLSIIQKYDNKKMHWISEADEGLYHAMNKGIKLASGDYLCFLNAGDTFFAKDSVEILMNSSETSPDIIYGETAIVNNNGEFLHMRRLNAPAKLSWRSYKQGMVVCHQSFIVKRELAESYDLSYKFSSDFDWCIRMMKKSNHIHNSHTTLINYLNEGMTTINRKASLKERYRIMTKYYGHISTFLHHLWFVIRAVINK